MRAAILGPIFAEEPAAAVAMLATGMSAGAGRAVRLISPVFRKLYQMRHNRNSGTVAAGREKVVAALDRLESELQPSGYLVGDLFSVADLTAAALFCPLVMPLEFQYRPPEPPPKLLIEYRNALSGRPGIQWVSEMYHRHRGTSAEVVA